ncbi:hypothetical protein Bca52824_080770 [Brassica carinata]|uniref:Uncharacterized protein n=1 Tax=Brassica carinata TaxID=52824 RepID=A0A8X7TQX8_BRACI|nr:hypothetical protein Bca52824_080770 [Brassica carinata]
MSDGCIAISKSIPGGLTDLIPRSHGDSGRLWSAAAAIIESAVFSNNPSASPSRTRCLLATTSTGSVQLRYCFVLLWTGPLSLLSVEVMLFALISIH